MGNTSAGKNIHINKIGSDFKSRTVALSDATSFANNNQFAM